MSIDNSGGVPVANITVTERPQTAVRIIRALVDLFLATSLVLTLAYVAPTLGKLVDDNVEEKARDACYERHTSAITEASFGVSASIGALVVGIAVPSDQRDLATIARSVDDIKAFTTSYRAAIDARKAYVVDGRPLPCPLAE